LTRVRPVFVAPLVVIGAFSSCVLRSARPDVVAPGRGIHEANSDPTTKMADSNNGPREERIESALPEIPVNARMRHLILSAFVFEVGSTAIPEEGLLRIREAVSQMPEAESYASKNGLTISFRVVCTTAGADPALVTERSRRIAETMIHFGIPESHLKRRALDASTMEELAYAEANIPENSCWLFGFFSKRMPE
jgi:hypothetical protein